MSEQKGLVEDFHHCELWVGNARQAAHYYCTSLGFEAVAYSGLETGSRDRVSYVLRQGSVHLVVTSPLAEGGEIGAHIDRHGDGVKDVAFLVDDAEALWKQALERGAESAAEPAELRDEGGTAVVAAVRTFGDTVHSLVQRNGYEGPFLPGFGECPVRFPGRSVGLERIDHAVGNQGDGQMQPVCDFYERVFGWHRFWTVDDKDISTEYSSLRSIVMASQNERVKMPINEPAEGRRKSQIQEFVDYYGGGGIQHLALTTSDIVGTVYALRDNGVAFLPTPASYYEGLAQRVGDISEEVARLAELGILVDADEGGYMLQIFTQPLQDRPTLFFEVIQRKGSESFGKGNFKALFESIEREQERRGNL